MKTTKAKLETRRTIYKGRIFSLEVDRVELPSGHTVDMEIVRHPGSVVMLPMPSAGEIILIRQYRYTIDRWIWELPAGSLKPGEDPDSGGRARVRRGDRRSFRIASSGCAGSIRRRDSATRR